jgi:hypothetical protein
MDPTNPESQSVAASGWQDGFILIVGRPVQENWLHPHPTTPYNPWAARWATKYEWTSIVGEHTWGQASTTRQ